MIGLRTIRTGECVAVWNARGEMRLVDGPARMMLFRQTVQRLPHFSAEADEYLVIRYRDGSAEHLPGPADVWWDPVRHEEVLVKKSLAINAHEAIVVYRRDNGDVARRVVTGPALFVPTAREWLHEFSWHGSDPKHPRGKRPHRLQFTKLWVIPDQMYFDVDDVRTSDDALLVIQVMIFFELVSIETMLDQTHDPVADFINALAADVIDFAAGTNFEQFKLSTERLNDLETYPNLTRRAERIGYRINKVVYRGYQANPTLQQMHDNAIEMRTRLKLDAETEQQAQELADLQLASEAKRADLQRTMEHEQAAHQQQLRQMKHEQHIRQLQAEQQQQAGGQRLLNDVELDHQKATNAEQSEYLKSMQAMQVDLTRYLVAQYQHPDRLIRVDAGPDGAAPQVHMHEE